jgi:tripartite-type tricarboxylate transporter receptor subunit TctC
MVGLSATSEVTVAQALPGYEGGSWFGLGAPRGTAAGIVALLNAAVNEALAEPAVRQRLSDLGGSAMPGSSPEFAAFIAAETARYAEIIRFTGVRAG